MALPSTAAHAAAQHVNGRIAWPTNTSGWNESDANGANVHTVTPSGSEYKGTGHVSEVVYSPDGTKVAFTVAVSSSGGMPTGQLWTGSLLCMWSR